MAACGSAGYLRRASPKALSISRPGHHLVRCLAHVSYGKPAQVSQDICLSRSGVSDRVFPINCLPSDHCGKESGPSAYGKADADSLHRAAPNFSRRPEMQTDSRARIYTCAYDGLQRCLVAPTFTIGSVMLLREARTQPMAVGDWDSKDGIRQTVDTNLPTREPTDHSQCARRLNFP